MENLKEKIRKEILHNLSTQARKTLAKKSKTIKNKLISLSEFKRAKCVMLYASKKNEVDTSGIIDEALRAGKRVALPRCTSLKTIVPKEISDRQKDLEVGTYGIYEPKERNRDVKLKEIDLVIVPGVAFDRRNRRLGRGRGHYDKFLKKLPPDKIKIGLAFDFQIVDSLPQDSHDIPVSKVITN